LPEEIGNSISLELPIESLKGIGDRIKKCEMIIIPKSIKSNILGLLKIQNLKNVSVTIWGTEVTKLVEAIRIINNHLNGSRRINKCKQELIEAGLKEYAKL
jgi:hypothetical protein